MNHDDSSESALLGGLILVFLAALIFGFVMLLVGPARKAQDYVNMLASTLDNDRDRALFRMMYSQQGAKNVVAAWFLTAFFTPSIAYLYLGEYLLAALSFFTAQGCFMWWIISLFSMPFETLAKNKRIADQTLINLRMARPE
jgi:hypothetical protein